MTSYNFTVENIARAYAEIELESYGIGNDIDPLILKRYTYDAEVTAFNAATVATITTLAITLISSSVVWFVLFAGCYLVRGSIERAIHSTRPVEADEFNEPYERLTQEYLVRACQFIPETRQEKIIANALQINDQNWKLNQCKFLDFVLWKNFAPRVDLDYAFRGS